jgi:hypothetical protein
MLASTCSRGNGSWAGQEVRHPVLAGHRHTRSGFLPSPRWVVLGPVAGERLGRDSRVPSSDRTGV